MKVTIFGLLGHANRLELPLESLEVEELAPGEEFAFNGRVYEIHSVTTVQDGFAINVSLVMNQATG